MRARDRLLTVIAAVLGLPAVPALASTPSTFGAHVRDCARAEGLPGLHNPGMYQGAAGWDGQPCQ